MADLVSGDDGTTGRRSDRTWNVQRLPLRLMIIRGMRYAVGLASIAGVAGVARAVDADAANSVVETFWAVSLGGICSCGTAEEPPLTP